MSTELRDQVGTIGPTDEDFVRCRTIGHAWDVIEEVQELGPSWRVWRHYIRLRCTSCTTERHDGINDYGEVGQRFYRYPLNYQYARGEPVPTKSEFRLRFVSVSERRRKPRSKKAAS